MSIDIKAALLTATILFAAAPGARACDGDQFDGCVISGMSGASTTMTFFFPTILPQMSSEENGVPNKQAFLKIAAVEAAELVAGGEIGPNLALIIEANPGRNEAELIDEVLAAAESL